MVTAPNQKIVHVNRSKYQKGFLQIGIDDWITASKLLKPSSFLVYLYLSSQSDGYYLALSRAAIEAQLDIKRTAYYAAVDELIQYGYLKLREGNVYEFYMTPVESPPKES